MKNLNIQTTDPKVAAQSEWAKRMLQTSENSWTLFENSGNAIFTTELTLDGDTWKISGWEMDYSRKSYPSKSIHTGYTR